MNRNYKVIWNQSLGCFMAVAEYAKSRGKSSNGAVSSGTSSLVTRSAQAFGLSMLRSGMAAAGLTSLVFIISPQALAETGTLGGTSSQDSSTAISPTGAIGQCDTLGEASITGTLSTNSTAIGCGTTIDDAPDSVAIGSQNTATATNGTQQQIGERRGGPNPRPYATGETFYTGTAVAVGKSNSVGAGGGIALGNSNQVTSVFHGVAVGQGNLTSGGYAVGLGVGNLSSGVASVALGTANESTGNTSVAIGRQTYALADFSIAAGNIATVEAGAVDGIALGTNSRTTVAGGVAIGLDSEVTGANSAALGQGSVAVAQTGDSYLTNVAATTDGTVSVGSSTIKRRITNLADGAAASDAVTVAQLQSTVSAGSAGNTTRSIGNMTALGGTYNAATDTYTAPTYTLDNGANTGTNTTVNNVGDALTNLDGRTTTNTTGIADLASGKTGLVRQDAGTGAITVGGQTGGTSVSFANVDGDARQLNGVASAGDISVAANANNAVNAADVNTAVTGLTNSGLQFSGDSTTPFTRKLGEELKVRGGAMAADLTENNIGVVASNGDTLTVKLNKDIDLGNTGSVTTGNTVTKNAGVRIDDGTGNITTITTAGTTVTDGTNTSNYGADGFSATDADGNTSTFNQAGVSFTDDLGAATGPSISATGINANNTKLSNLADGTAAGDAATFGQLTDTNNVATGNLAALGGTYDAATDTYTAPTYTLDNGANTGTNTTVNNVGDALTNLDGRTTTNTTGIADLASGKTGLVRQDAGTGAITVGGQTGGTSVNFTGTDGVRTLSGLANGNVATGSTQAITGDQLNSSAASLATVIGGNATNTGGIVTATNIGGTGVNTIDGAISSVKDAATKAKSTVTEGKNITVTSSTNTDGSTDYNVKTKDDLALTSVTTGNTVTNNAGVRIDDGTGNITTITTAGTTVTDGTNTSNYGADGFSATDTDGNTSTFNQAGVSFTDDLGAATGPSISTTGINANNTKISNLADGTTAGDAATFGQLNAVASGINAGAVQYERNTDSSVNYNQVSFRGTPAQLGKDDNDNDIVVSGGTLLTNVANGINAADAVNKGQLDSATKVKLFDKNGDEVTINIAEQVANTSVNDSNLDSLFLTYDVAGQEVTDRLSIGETVQRMNTEGVKFAHTNAVSAQGDLGITNDSSAGGANSTAIGVNAIIASDAESTIALGHDTRASAAATKSVVIGADSQVNGASSVAIGDGAQANGTQSISVGTGNIVNGNNSGAFGDPSIINGNNSYSVGNNNTIDSNDTFVLGNNVTQTVEGSVVLGTGSAATTGAGIIGFGAVDNSMIMATTSTTGAVAVGDAANGIYRQVTGVAAGTADSDAVNVSQLKAVSDALGSSNESLSNAAVQYDKNPDNTVNKGSITLDGGAAGTTITNVKDGQISANSTDAINGGQLYNLGNDVAGIIGGDAQYDTAGNLTVSNIGGTGEGNISDAIAAVNNGNAQSNQDIQANSSDIQANTDRLDSGLNFGADNGDNVNKSVGDSTALQFEGSDNITTTTTESGIQFDLSGNINVDNVTADTVTTGNTVINDTGVTIQDGPSITVEGINASNTVISGVEAGVEEKDAVNFGQLSALDKKLGDSVNALGYRIGEVEDNANAGISAAMAMSSLPQAYIPGKSMVGGGIASYNGESAVAVGVSKVSDNGRWVIKVNGTADTQGNAGGAIGAGFHF